ncbi:MAG: CBS domain-containing protein [Candidatus Bathyarchaeota archaeon]
MPSVKDLMSKNVITIDLNKTVFDAAVLMTDKKIGCLVVIDGETPIGIVTERDFVRRIIAEKTSIDAKVFEIMSKPLITVDPDSSLRRAAGLMVDNKIRRLPVVIENKLVGILVVSDFARQLTKKTLTEEMIEAIARYNSYPTPF